MEKLLFAFTELNECSIFYNMVSICKKSNRFFVFDLPGHGYSENAKYPDKNLLFSGICKNHLQALETLNCNSFYILGLSLGGHIATHMLKLEPLRCPV